MTHPRTGTALYKDANPPAREPPRARATAADLAGHNDQQSPPADYADNDESDDCDATTTIGAPSPRPKRE